MTNSPMIHASRMALLALSLAVGCFSNDNSGGAGASSSSGSHWLACSDDGDCAKHGDGATCGKDNVCVNAAGDPIVLDIIGGSGGAGGAGAGAGGSSSGTGGTSGGGGSGGTSGGYDPCAGKDCGDECQLCAPDDEDCVESKNIKACDAQGDCSGIPVSCGGGVDAGTGIVFPDCESLSALEGAMCAGTDDKPAPACCQGDGAHLACEFEACTASFPGNCSGTWQPIVGSTACGGSGSYEPCAAKDCGDECTICDPNDKTCVETQEVKVCTGTGGMCTSGAVDCSPPESCDPSGANSCGAGQACCEVGRCGPVGTTEGICEAADLKTGGCKPCACAMQPGGCPICNSPDTLILTPDGEREIADLREGDLVMSLHHGEVVAVPVLRTRNVEVFDHAVVRLTLDNGSVIEVSGSHPIADGQRLDAVQAGDTLGDVHVLSTEMVPYTHDRTYDILPASDTGTYFAGGALLGSTLMVPGVF